MSSSISRSDQPRIRTPDAAQTLARLLERVGHDVGLVVRPVVTDGSQPIGKGIGPALEARTSSP